MKPADPSRGRKTGCQNAEGRQALRHAKLTRTGTGVALTCLAFVIQLETITRVGVLREHRAHCFVILALICGLLMLFRGRLAADHRTNPEAILTFYRRARFWGTVLLASAAITQVVLPVRLGRPRVQEAIQEAEPPPPVASPREFPNLDVTGFVLNGQRSSAVINGKTVMLGEDVYGVQLVAVTTEGIVVELEGQRKDYGYHTD